jgi:hypothetical protein
LAWPDPQPSLYGSFVPGKEISFSETEYREGRKLGKPCLVYMRDDDVLILPKDFETDPEKLRLLDNFKGVLNERHTVAKFRQPRDLADRIKADLLETIELVETEQRRLAKAENERFAFFSEVRAIIDDALSNGYRETLVLSALRSALEELQPKPQGWTVRFGAFLRELVNPPSPAISGGKVPTVFFSYAHRDKAIVDKVANALRRYRVATWIDRERAQVGAVLMDQIRSGLTDADAFVVFASHSSLESPWVDHEMKYFINERLTGNSGPPIIPVVLDDVELPAILRDVLYVYLRDGNVRDAARRIAAAAWKIDLSELR